MRKDADPLKLTPFKITVMRRTQDGIEVKSMVVPEVLVTAVPAAIPLYTAPEFVVTPAEPLIVTAITSPLSVHPRFVPHQWLFVSQHT